MERRAGEAGVRKMRRSTNGIYQMMVAIWLTISVASVFLAAITWLQLSNRLAASTEAVTLHDTVGGVWKMLLENTSAQRGFTITGSETFLISLKKSEAGLPGQFERLTKLARTDPELPNQGMGLHTKIKTHLS